MFIRRIFVYCFFSCICLLCEGQNCQNNYSMVRSRFNEFDKLQTRLEQQNISKEVIDLYEFDLIHFNETVALARKYFDEEFAKLRNSAIPEFFENPEEAFDFTDGGFEDKEGPCSVKCGVGERIRRRILCKDLSDCTRPKIETYLEKCVGPLLNCPPYTYGEWGPWSPCTKTCIESSEDIPYRTRVRTCNPRCSFGKVEERACRLPFCPPVCPEYTATLGRDAASDLRIQVLFKMEPPKFSFGSTIRQEITLRDVYSHEVADTFNISYNQLSRIADLKINSAYVPEIKIINQILVNSSYTPISLLAHHCFGRTLECNFFICDDGSRILADQLCNNKFDCSDKSDEIRSRCTGEFTLPFIIVSLILIAFIFFGVGVFLAHNRDHFCREDDGRLSSEHLSNLREEYSEAHEKGQTKEFLNKYQSSRDVLLKVVKPVEMEAHGSLLYKALECLKKSNFVAGGNVVVMSSLTQRIKYMIPSRARRILEGVFYGYKSCSFYFDVYKDMALIFALYHISSEILNFRYGGGIRLDLLAYYLIAVVISSQVIIHSFSFLSRRKDSDKWRALIFPIHNAFDKPRLFCQLQLLETFFERVPQLIIHLCLWRASTEYPRVGLLLFFVLDGKWGLSARAIFVISVVTTYFGILKSVIAVYLNDRYPLRPTGHGLFIQFVAFSGLLIPKTLVISWTLRDAPYLFPILVILECLLFACLFKIPWCMKLEPFDTEILAGSTIVPGFYRKNACCVLQNVLASMLQWAIIYLPADVILRGLLLKRDPLQEYDVMDYAALSLTLYSVGTAFYVFFSFLYYVYGHNWSVHIRKDKFPFKTG